MPYRPHHLLAAMLLLAPIAAQAKEPAKGISKCGELLKEATPFSAAADSKSEEIKGGCHFTDIILSTGPVTRWEIAEVTVTGDDLFAAVSSHRIPNFAEISLTGMQLTPEVGSPVSRYLMEVMQPHYNVHLAYRLDEAAQTLTVDDLSLAGDEIGSASATAVLTGDRKMPRRLDSPADLGNAAFQKLSLRLDNSHRLFEGMALPPLLAALPPDDDPHPTIASYQQIARAFVQALPDTVAGTDSKQVLSDFINQFPHPQGTYRLDIEAKQPMPLSKLTPGDAAPALTNLLSTLAVTATHEAVAK